MKLSGKLIEMGDLELDSKLQGYDVTLCARGLRMQIDKQEIVIIGLSEEQIRDCDLRLYHDVALDITNEPA